MSGKVDLKSTPYRAYMQITCLEMEKARRDSERQSASRRIAEIDARMRDIEAEKAAILKSLSEPGAADGATLRKGATKFLPPRGRGQFKVRY
jgi:hypothetical protein